LNVTTTWVNEVKTESKKGEKDKISRVRIGYIGPRTGLVFRDIQPNTAAADRIYGDVTYEQLEKLQDPNNKQVAGIQGRTEKEWAKVFKEQVEENVTEQTKLVKAWREAQKDPAKLEAFNTANPTFKPYRGGRHGFLTGKLTVGDTLDSHHTPAKGTYLKEADYNLGPAVQMEKADHQKTGSYGASKGDPYFDSQSDFINKDKKFWEALKKDLKNVPEAAGTPTDPKDTYKDALDEMLDSIHTVAEWRGPLIK
jgi:hypothetical protein